MSVVYFIDDFLLWTRFCDQSKLFDRHKLYLVNMKCFTITKCGHLNFFFQLRKCINDFFSRWHILLQFVIWMSRLSHMIEILIDERKLSRTKA